MEEVEIKNVGGRGVASEVTLALLLDAVKKQNGDTDTTERRLRDLNNRSIRNNTDANNDQSGKLKKASKHLGDFSKELVKGSDRLGGLMESLFGNNLVSRLAKYGDQTIDQFRSLSSVGASFNNSMLDMMGSSAGAAMSLEDFIGMVKSNSEDLALLGGTATRGAKFIGDFSREIRTGIGQRFFEMGMTMEQVNEGLISYLTLETMRGRRNLRSDGATQAAAAEYVEQLDSLSKLTGKQKDALMDTQAAMQSDVKMRNQLSRIEEQFGSARMEELRSIYTLQKETLPGFHDSLMDLTDGVAQTDLGKILQQNVPGITDFMHRVSQGSVGMDEYTEFMQNTAGPAMKNFAERFLDASFAAMEAAGGFTASISEAASMGYEFNRIMNMNVDEMNKEQQRRALITGTLAKFEQAMAELRSYIFETIIKSPFGRQLIRLADTITNAFSAEGSGAFSRLKDSIKWMSEKLFGEQGFLTKGVQSFTDYLSSEQFTTDLANLGEHLSNVATAIGEFYNKVRDDGLWNTIKESFDSAMTSMGTAITGFWEGQFATDLKNTISYWFEELVFNIMNSLNETWFGGAMISNRSLSEMGESLEESKFSSGRMSAEESAAYEASLRAEMARHQDFIENARGWQNREVGPRSERINEIAALLESVGSQSFAQGTNGFQNFGSGTPAILHNTEAVVPRHTPAGDLLSQFYDQQKKSPSHSPMANSNQSGVVEKLNELNSNIVRLLSATQQGVAAQEKTAKGVRGMGTDMLRGAGL